MKIPHFKGMDNLMIMLIPLFPYCAVVVVKDHFFWTLPVLFTFMGGVRITIVTQLRCNWVIENELGNRGPL